MAGLWCVLTTQPQLDQCIDIKTDTKYCQHRSVGGRRTRLRSGFIRCRQLYLRSHRTSACLSRAKYVSPDDANYAGSARSIRVLGPCECDRTMGSGLPLRRMVSLLCDVQLLCSLTHAAASDRDKAGLSIQPFRVNSGELNITADVYLAPFAEVALELCRS